MNDAREFDCVDCGAHVITFIDDSDKPSVRCLTCQWAYDNGRTEEERKQLRKLFEGL
jgi:hypothetical protein